jgi:hypothetical protein
MNLLRKIKIWIRVIFVGIPKEIKYKLRGLYDIEDLKYDRNKRR